MSGSNAISGADIKYGSVPSVQKYQCVVSTNSNHIHLLRDDRMVCKIEGLIEQTAIPSNSSGEL
jgi:hypothetical protein